MGFQTLPNATSHLPKRTASLKLFSELGLSAKVLAAVHAAGYNEPTPIQEQAIPHALERRDVLGIAQTGTGKTASFVLPMLTMLEKGRARARMPRTLIIEPTRELAAQARQRPVFQRGDAGGIIAAIFEPLQRVDETVRHLFAADDADDSAHGLVPGLAG